MSVGNGLAECLVQCTARQIVLPRPGVCTCVCRQVDTRKVVLYLQEKGIGKIADLTTLSE
jgi:hypothetical protein